MSENYSEEQRAIEEITHILLHALTEESIGEKLDGAKSQQEVYEALKTLPYFKLTMDEFKIGIEALRQQQAEVHQHEHEHECDGEGDDSER
ncbi:MAG: hypothetical protein ACI4OH_02580 [Mitsuokella sp.]|uniref:hypothetical protein n=1 Tax=Mitsuokella sp. TaxID=2049034 RepID=UPI003D7CE1DA